MLSEKPLLTGGVKLNAELGPCGVKQLQSGLMQLCLFDPGVPPQHGQAGISAGISGPCHSN